MPCEKRALPLLPCHTSLWLTWRCRTAHVAAACRAPGPEGTQGVAAPTDAPLRCRRRGPLQTGQVTGDKLPMYPRSAGVWFDASSAPLAIFDGGAEWWKGEERGKNRYGHFGMDMCTLTEWVICRPHRRTAHSEMPHFFSHFLHCWWNPSPLLAHI
ncbi:hypothetical protein B0H19DRAFT_1080105 [Mycena capillaripes]|nr:hypothetical protein B0H19DRAFT_1080105 [Mycena capillaripes]